MPTPTISNTGAACRASLSILRTTSSWSAGMDSLLPTRAATAAPDAHNSARCQYRDPNDAKTTEENVDVTHDSCRDRS